MLYAFISPLGYGITEFQSVDDKLPIQWTKFSGDLQEQAEQYYRIITTGDYSEFISLLPKNGEIHIGQRAIWEKIQPGTTNDLDVIYTPVFYDLQNKIYSQFTNDEQQQLDQVIAIIAGLRVQKKDTRDVFISQAINAIDDLTAQINLVHNRLIEWHGAHFPELGEYIKDIPQFFRLVNLIGDRNSVWPELNLSERKMERLKQFSEASLGAQISIDDIIPIQELARLGSQLVNSKKELEEYIENATMIIMPNITRLVGALIAARLLSHAGSLESLSRFPSSTMQLLGAEKALFRHLKTGERPPKHGIIFQSPRIHQAPFHQRGRRARALAGKLTIASRLDYFAGEDMGTGLEEDVEKRMNYISEKFAKPPKRKKDKFPTQKYKGGRGSGDRRGDDRKGGYKGGRGSGDRRGGDRKGKYKGGRGSGDRKSDQRGDSRKKQQGDRNRKKKT